MSSTAVLGRDAVRATVDRYVAALSELAGLSLDGLDVPDLLAVVDAMQTGCCQTPSVEHEALRHLARQATAEQVGKSLSRYLADRLRIRKGEAARRLADAQMLGPRATITGEPLQPLWPATAAGQRAGRINADHAAEIGRFFTQLPRWVDAGVRERCEADLAQQAMVLRPDELRVLAQGLADCVNQDGNFTDEDRAGRRGITIGRQGIDGMAKIIGWVNPELCAGLEAVFGKWAAPGAAKS